MVLKITNLHILRYLPTYWLYLLERYTIDNQRCTHTVSKGGGGAQPNISKEIIVNHDIHLPPLAEQQRIVQKIEELFSVLDNIQNALEV